MENHMMIFKNPAFGEVRTIKGENNTPWFVGNDVAKALGYKNFRDALSRHVDEEDKGVVKHDTLGGSQNLAIINESGLYSLVLSSKLPQAKAFKRWVTSEVLPAIRKDGGYIATKADDTPEEIMARALLIAKSTIDRLEQENKRLSLTKRRKPVLPRYHSYCHVTMTSHPGLQPVDSDNGVFRIRLLIRFSELAAG